MIEAKYKVECEGNAINYAAWGYANAWFGAATHASLFIIEEIST